MKISIFQVELEDALFYSSYSSSVETEPFSFMQNARLRKINFGYSVYFEKGSTFTLADPSVLIQDGDEAGI
jgi:hypothetical protein